MQNTIFDEVDIHSETLKMLLWPNVCYTNTPDNANKIFSSNIFAFH